MKITLLRWSSVTAGALSTVWIALLAALVIRCKLIDQPFPVLAKLSPFHDHLMLVVRWLSLFPVFGLVAALLVGVTWCIERNFRPLRSTALAAGTLLSASPLVIFLNPGGYFSWFLS
ncbi:MAG TPA: hypothetical protein VL793_02245 [Patescibacteria group bacterium]|nr:hypothetical protein [Patescibacteria group bacterium]